MNCPDCAEDGRVRRMRLVEETFYTNRGWECLECEFFIALQNLYEPDLAEWRGDADPGL